MNHPAGYTSRDARILLLALALAVLPALGLNADVLITGSGKEFEVMVKDRNADGLVVSYKGNPALVRWKNITWISGSALYTMTNGKQLVFHAVRPTDAGWIVRPVWVREGGLFELDRSLVRQVTTPLEIEREYLKLSADAKPSDIGAQFDLLKWCIRNGRDDLACPHARALQETRNAWNLAVVMQASLVGMPRADIPLQGSPERDKAILRAIHRTVVESRRQEHVAAIGYRIAAFDLAAGRVARPSGDVKQYLEMLYTFVEAATTARTEYEQALEETHRAVDCPKCKGTGRMRGRYLGRETDERLGQLLSDGKALDIREGFEIVECDRCGGTGKVIESTDLPQGPAGVKRAISPALWKQLYAAADRFLRTRIPMEMNDIYLERN
jgi:hypothetical protein